MELVARVLLIAFVYGLLYVCNAVDYKFLKIENCSSSDEEIIRFETCKHSDSDMNVTLTMIQPMDNLTVSSLHISALLPLLVCLISVLPFAVQRSPRRVAPTLQSSQNWVVQSHGRNSESQSITQIILQVIPERRGWIPPPVSVCWTAPGHWSKVQQRIRANVPERRV